MIGADSCFKRVTRLVEDMAYANNDGVRLAYDESGPTNAPSVVFIEGLGYGRWMWRWQRRALDSYHTLCWDNRGTGDSDEPEGPYTIDQMASDVEAVLADAGVARAHVVGASMGGMIALQYALNYDRVQSLALCCTSPGGPEAHPVPEATRKQMFDVPADYDEREERRYKMRPAFSKGFAEANENLIERIIDWRLASDASEQARLWQSEAVGAFDVHDRLGEIEVPTLIMHGTADRVVPVENGELLATGVPNAEFVPFDDAPHLFFIEQADRVNDRLLEFLDDV